MGGRNRWLLLCPSSFRLAGSSSSSSGLFPDYSNGQIPASPTPSARAPLRRNPLFLDAVVFIRRLDVYIYSSQNICVPDIIYVLVLVCPPYFRWASYYHHFLDFSFLFSPPPVYSGAWTWPFFLNSAGRRMAIHYELEERNFCLSWTKGKKKMKAKKVTSQRCRYY
jgi:hypothetical protein